MDTSRKPRPVVSSSTVPSVPRSSISYTGKVGIITNTSMSVVVVVVVGGELIVFGVDGDGGYAILLLVYLGSNGFFAFMMEVHILYFSRTRRMQ